jgi:hypothetical protein
MRLLASFLEVVEPLAQEEDPEFVLDSMTKGDMDAEFANVYLFIIV